MGHIIKMKVIKTLNFTLCLIIHLLLNRPTLTRLYTKLYRQAVVISKGTYCAYLVANLFLFCYERDIMMSLSDDKQSDILMLLTLNPDVWTIF